MFSVDPWEKAAECDRAVGAAADPQQRMALTNLRDLWIELAKERDSMSAEQAAKEAEWIGRLHVELAVTRQRVELGK